MDKSLVIAPHVDDEVLGCGGILDDSFHVYFCGINKFHVVSKDDRIKEIFDVSSFLGYTWEYNDKSIVDSYEVNDFINIFEGLINNIKPYRVFIPYKSYNRDHHAIYNAAMIALRPHDKNHFVRQVFVYEEPDCFWYKPNYEVNYFVPIDINKKIDAYLLHMSQVRGHRSTDHIKSLATVRGMVVNQPYAEAYITKRIVDNEVKHIM